MGHMFFLQWFNEMLAWVGLYQKEAKILFLGIDNAGKTTLLQVLKDDRLAAHNPTLHPHSEELVINRVRFRALDLGGHQTARRVWNDYTSTVDAIMYIVDTADVHRLVEAKEALDELLNQRDLDNVPIAILGNKIDLPSSISEEELRGYLHLHSDFAERKLKIFMCSVVKNVGYSDAFQWISSLI